MLLNVDRLQKQLDKDEFQEDGSMTAFWVYDRRVNKGQLQTQESKIDTGKAVDGDLVVIKSSGTESEVQDDSSRLRNDTDADDADIRPIYDEEPMVERRESIFAKPDHMIVSSESRNISKNMPRFSLNDIVHNYYIEGARKKTQERNRNLKSSVMHTATASPQSTADGSKPKPRRNNQTSRSFPVSKSRCVMITVVPKADHSKNSSSFPYYKHFVCSRLGGHTAVYQFFMAMLKHLDIEDLNQLWALVKETLSIRQASRDKEKELWVERKRLFEPDFEDQL
nr:hypothetical protein [Tanacetum cinerariifolium]